MSNLTDPPERARCTATANRTGRRCRRWAIAGGNVCRSHGGAAPQVKGAALARRALRDLGRLDRPGRSPRAVLLDALATADALLLDMRAAVGEAIAPTSDDLERLAAVILLASRVARAAIDAGVAPARASLEELDAEIRQLEDELRRSGGPGNPVEVVAGALEAVVLNLGLPEAEQERAAQAVEAYLAEHPWAGNGAGHA